MITFSFQARKEEIDNFLAKKMERKGILALLLSSEIEFSPLDMKEVAFDVIGSHCLDSTHVGFIITVNKKNNNFHIETIYMYHVFLNPWNFYKKLYTWLNIKELMNLDKINIHTIHACYLFLYGIYFITDCCKWMKSSKC